MGWGWGVGVGLRGMVRVRVLPRGTELLVLEP